MKKIIIKENLNEQNRAVAKVIDLSKALNPVLLQFKLDTGYSISLSDVKRLVEGQQDFFHDVLNSFLDTQLDEKNITGELMRRNFKAGAGEFVNKLLTKISGIVAIHGSDYMEYLSMNKGMLILKHEQEEIIRDSHRLCIESDDAIEFFNKHKEAAEKMTELLVFVKEKTWINNLFQIEAFAVNFFSLDNQANEIIINNRIDYERSLLKNKPKRA